MTEDEKMAMALEMYQASGVLESMFGIRALAIEEGAKPGTFKLVVEPAGKPVRSTFGVSNLWEMTGIESALKEAESALVSKAAMQPPEQCIHWSKPDDPSYVPPMDFDALARGELAMHASASSGACGCRLLYARDASVLRLSSATMAELGWDILSNANGYRWWCAEHKPKPSEQGDESKSAPGCTLEELRSALWENEQERQEWEKRLDAHMAKRQAKLAHVGSADLCIKHGFRGTREQPECPECKGDGGYFLFGSSPVSQVRVYSADKPDLTERYRTFILTGSLPAQDFDDTTEPSTPPKRSDDPTYTTRYGQWEEAASSAPEKRSDEPTPAWIEANPSHFAGIPITRATKLCGCMTIDGITFSCLACAKGGEW